MSTLCPNILYSKAKIGGLVKVGWRRTCTAFQPRSTITKLSQQTFGLRLVTNPLIVQFAKNAGYDALWVEMEHSTFSITEASLLASAGMMAGITPIVRVPYECGMGYVQQVLDSGAMVVVFPHIVSAAETRAAVKMCKFPPLGKRSLWLQQASVGLKSMPPAKLASVVNAQASSVGVMIEAAESIENIDEIAAVEGVDLLMVGCIDLSSDMGIPGEIDHPKFRKALEAVSRAAKRYNRVFGLAGNYNNPEFQDWVINTLGVRLFLCNVDSNILSVGAMECIAKVNDVDRTRLLN